MRTNIGFLLVTALAVGGHAGAATLTVTNTADSGPGSLQQAIMDANVAAEPSTIVFQIPGPGPHIIRPAQLPTVTVDGLTIDGFTQPGSSPNSATNYDNAVRLIDIRGAIPSGPYTFFQATANRITIRGLILSGYSWFILLNGSGHQIAGNLIGMDSSGAVPLQGASIVVGSDSVVGGTQLSDRNIIVGCAYLFALSVGGGPGDRVEGNFIGVGPDGRTAIPNLGAGVNFYSPGGVVGGSAPGAGNVISGTKGVGIDLGAGSDIVVEGNLIGTDPSGAIVIPNGFGVYGQGGSRNRIGGPGPGEGNKIVGNGTGIEFLQGSDNVVQGNLITCAPTGIGVRTLGNDTLIGGRAPGERNFIHDCTYGVFVDGSTGAIGNRILSNVIDGGVTAIELEPSCGPTGGNDPGDSDTGPNNCQNHPVLTRSIVSQDGTRLFVSGNQISSPASGANEIQFFNAGSGPYVQAAALLHDESGLPSGSFPFQFIFSPEASVLPSTDVDATATTNDGTSWLSDAVATELNQPPVVAGAGEQLLLFGSGSVTLDGSGSSDPDGLPNGTIEFQWQQIGGPGVTPPSLTAPTLTFVPPSPGSYVFRLAVSDGLDSSTATFIATVYTPLAIDSSAILPSGREKRGYAARLLASGGVLPITWKVVAGVLPPGLSLSEDGLLSGTPQGKGQFHFTAEVGDRVGTKLQQTFSLRVSPATVLLAPRG